VARKQITSPDLPRLGGRYTKNYMDAGIKMTGR